MDGLDVKTKVTNKDQVMKIYTDDSGFHIPTISMRALNRKVWSSGERTVAADERRGSFQRTHRFTGIQTSTFAPIGRKNGLEKWKVLK